MTQRIAAHDIVYLIIQKSLWTTNQKSNAGPQNAKLNSLKKSTNIAEAARTHDLTPAEVERWVDDAMQGMGNALKTNPKDITEPYEKKLDKMHAAYGEAMLQIRFLKKLQSHLDQTED